MKVGRTRATVPSPPDPMDTDRNGRTGLPLRAFAQRVLVAVAIVSAAILLWWIRFALMLGFAAIIVATVLVAAGEPFRRWGRFPHRASVVAGGVVITVLLGGFGWLVWPKLSAQGTQLLKRLPTSVQELERRLGQVPDPLANMSPSTLISDIAQYFTSWTTTLLETGGSLILILIAGSFLAAAPSRYRRGLVALFPSRLNGRVDHGLSVAGLALRRWLLAQLLAMLIVGSMIGAGAWLIGLPSPLALALVAALFEFVPIAGPILGAVPALLVALSGGFEMILWTVLLFVAVQQLESNVIMPLVEQEMVDIPPAVLLLAIAAFGTLLGFPGVLLGAPMTVMAYALVREMLAGRPR